MSDVTNYTPPVMVAIGADLIREAVKAISVGAKRTRKQIDDWGWYDDTAERIEAEIARMEATAKALAEALPGGAE